MNTLLYPILVPIFLGLLIYFIPRKVKFLREILTLIGSSFVLGISIWLFINKPYEMYIDDSLIFNLDNLSSFILLSIGLFGFLISIYSLKYMQGKNYQSLYYGSLLWTIGAACGAALANNLIILLVFWGLLGVIFYLMILTGGIKADKAAKKSLIIIGGSDALMLLGIIFIYFLSSSFQVDKLNILSSSFQIDKLSIHFHGAISYIAFFAILSGVFSKAGAMPLHTWLPDVSETAPVSVTAFIPAALDKLLGIYLLARICIDIFVLTDILNLILMILGAFTIIAAVMMALIQHDMRKLLAYHAISQVGYMVIGIATANPIGIAGGLFHMINHAVYKSGLFLTSGAVQHRTGTTDLKKLGGIGKIMPFTFITFLICAFSISGIPPFNGFSSKWMIYQGLIEFGNSNAHTFIGNKLWIIWLIAAMFGSALTLASFMKLTHTVFLGRASSYIKSKKFHEVGFSMLFPMGILATICIIFGIFPFTLPLKMLILPVVSTVTYSGIWSSNLAALLIFIGLGIGFLIYFFGKVLSNVREADHFIGGEKLDIENRVTGTNFYNTIKEFGILKKIYGQAEAKVYDIYDQLLSFSEKIAEIFRKVHTGVLTMYLAWIIMTLIIFLIVLMGR